MYYDDMNKQEKLHALLHELDVLYPNAHIALNCSNNFELLVAVILSAQCTDMMVNRVTEKLFKKYTKINDYILVQLEEFEHDIRSTGFYHNKAKNIREAATIITEKYHGHVPDTMENLVSLPGVARKTANIVLGNAFGKVEGIAVETHVLRLSHVLGMSDAQTPEKVEQDLMKLLPKEKWFSITYQLIEYGRQFCTARKHDHANCPLTQYALK